MKTGNYLRRTGLTHPDRADFEKAVREMGRRLKEIKDGDDTEALGMVVYGPSRVGKSSLVRRLPELLPDLRSHNPTHQPIITARLSGGANLKGLYHDIAKVLNVTLKSRESATQMNTDIMDRFKALQTKVLVLEEAHHPLTGGKLDTRIGNEIKSAFLDSAYPVAVVMVGIPDVMKLITADTQLEGRMAIAEVRPLCRQDAETFAIAMVKRGCKLAGLVQNIDLYSGHAAPRLAEVAKNAFGRIIDLVEASLNEAIDQGSKQLTYSHVHAACHLHSKARSEVFNRDNFVPSLVYDETSLPEERGE